MLPGKMDGPHETVNRHSEIIRCACFFDGKCKKSRRIRPFVQNGLADQAGRIYTLLGRG